MTKEITVEELVKQISVMERKLDTFSDGMRVFDEEIAAEVAREAAMLFRKAVLAISQAGGEPILGHRLTYLDDGSVLQDTKPTVVGYRPSESVNVERGREAVDLGFYSHVVPIPDTPQSVPDDAQERIGFGYDAGVKCLRCGAKAGEPHLKFCPRLPEHLNEKYEAELDATPDAPLSQGEFPSGAIVNGEICLDRIEHAYNFECEAGPIANCSDWQTLRQCFGFMSDALSSLIAERDKLKEEVDELDQGGMALAKEIAKLVERVSVLEAEVEGQHHTILRMVEENTALEQENAALKKAWKAKYGVADDAREAVRE